MNPLPPANGTHGEPTDGGFDRAFWRALDELLKACNIVIDRPRGSRHPKYPECAYPADYGYLEGTMSTDGAAIDVWRGSRRGKEVCGMACTIDLLKKDAEMKVLVSCTRTEQAAILAFHNQGSMRAILVKRPVNRLRRGRPDAQPESGTA